MKTKNVEDRTSNHDRYITTNDFHKSLGSVFNERLTEASLTTNKNLGTVEQWTIKIEENTQGKNFRC